MFVGLVTTWLFVNVNIITATSAIFGPGVLGELISMWYAYIYDIVVFPIEVSLGGATFTGWGVSAALFLL